MARDKVLATRLPFLLMYLILIVYSKMKER